MASETLIKLKQINEKLLETRKQLDELKEQKDELLIKLFYEIKGLEYGQHFMYNGKEIVKVKVSNIFYLSGYYTTKKGEVSEKSTPIYIGDIIKINLW